MSISKKIIVAISAIVIGGVLVVGAGEIFSKNEAVNDDKIGDIEREKEEKNPDNSGIAYIAPVYEIVEQDQDKIRIQIKNQSETDMVLNYTSSQKFDIKFMQNGKHVYTWSSDKSFMQMMSKKIVKPGESEEYTIELKGLPLEKGQYDFEFYSVAQELEDVAPLEGSLVLESQEDPIQ